MGMKINFFFTKSFAEKFKTIIIK